MTPRCAFACPRCGGESGSRFYGPCERCRVELVTAAETRFAATLERVSAAVADGWKWDADAAVFRRGDEVRA